MKKKYLEPVSEQISVKVEYNFAGTGVTENPGANLNDPEYGGDD